MESEKITPEDNYWGACDCCRCKCISAKVCFRLKHKCCELKNRMGIHECSMV